VLGPLPVETINNTIETELEPGDVVFSRAAQMHAARRHPAEYPVCQPHLAMVVCNPLYIGDDHKNPDKIELISRIPAANSFVLVAVEVERDERGRYNVCSFYTLKKEQVDSRRNKGFLKIATKSKGTP
jgi:phage-Barnase-EndoU-ColicinE5/D-RelE like nuclease3